MAEKDPIEDILTYEKDIVPLRKQFFKEAASSKYLSPEAQANVSQQFGKQLTSSFYDRAKAQEVGEINMGRRIGFEAAKLELEKAREDAASKRNMFQTFEPFQKGLDAIISDESLDSSERKRQIGVYGVRNAALLTTNDVAAKAYGAAQLGVGEDDKKKFTVFDYVRSGGDTKYLSEINPDVTKVDVNQEVNPAWILDRLNKSGLFKERQKNAFEQQTKRQDEIKTTVDSLVSGLNSVKLTKPKFGEEGKVVDSFEDEGSAFKVYSVVEALGTEDDKNKFRSTPSARGQWDMARQIGANYIKDKVGGGTATSATTASSLFTSQKSQPEPTISPFPTQ
jgi:hypothetical protein